MKLALLCLALLPAVACAEKVRLQPQETDELFANPGMGWQTFHRFADEDRALQGLPTSSAYFRFYWREVEPRDGAIDFAKFDELLAHARRAGQQLAFRIMCTGSGEYMDVPTWLKEAGCAGVEFNYGGRKHWVPDFADPIFQRTHLRLIRELGARYDGHPELDLLDIGSVGLWGEWHMSGTEIVGTKDPVPLPSPELRLALIDAWCQAFPRTSKVILIGSDEGMARASTAGYGWRADCLGDMGGFSKTWNHMENFYLQQLEKTGAGEAWKRGPVAWESCWDMRKWKESSWDIRAIFDYALRCHGTYVNNKSAPLPDGTRGEVERLLKRLGYRLVLRELTHPDRIAPGETALVSATWQNAGVAPPYRDYRLALRMVADGGESNPLVTVSDRSIRGWLPGETRTDLQLPIPVSVKPGSYRLTIGVVDPVTHNPAVRLAIKGRKADGWYDLGRIEVQGGENRAAAQ